MCHLSQSAQTRYAPLRTCSGPAERQKASELTETSVSPGLIPISVAAVYFRFSSRAAWNKSLRCVSTKERPEPFRDTESTFVDVSKEGELSRWKTDTYMQFESDQTFG